MAHTATIEAYVRATSRARAQATATTQAFAALGDDQDDRFPSESSRAWADTFVMWDIAQSLPTVPAELYADAKTTPHWS